MPAASRSCFRTASGAHRHREPTRAHRGGDASGARGAFRHRRPRRDERAGRAADRDRLTARWCTRARCRVTFYAAESQYRPLLRRLRQRSHDAVFRVREELDVHACKSRHRKGARSRRNPAADRGATRRCRALSVQPDHARLERSTLISGGAFSCAALSALITGCTGDVGGNFTGGYRHERVWFERGVHGSDAGPGTL